MYSIGMFSKLGKVTVKTLRHYDEVGLLVPARVDEISGYRYYTTQQLFRLNRIVALRQMGFAIPEIRQIVDGHDEATILAARRVELEKQAANVGDQLFRLNNYLNEERNMKYQAVTKEIPACVVYAAKYMVPNYAALGKIMPELGAKVARLNPGLKCVEPDYCFNVYLDDEYRERDINVEICQAVTARGRDAEGVVFKDLPAVEVVAVLHRGAYEEIGAAYAYAMEWVEKNGYRVADHVRESYIDGPWNKESMSDWLTEIQVPVVKR